MTQKFKKTTLTLAIATSFMLGAIPIFTLAEEIKVNDPISEYEGVKKEAESLGIEVTEQFKDEGDIFEDELDKINKANEAVNASYKAAKDAISEKIKSYKSEVDKNKQAFETAIKAFAGNDANGNQKDVWDTSKWAEFLLGEEGKGLNDAISKAQDEAKTNLQNKRLSLLMAKISNMAFVTPATNETKLISIKRKNEQDKNKYDDIDLQSADKLKTGDIIRYAKVFKSNKAITDTNKDGWVDLRLTIEKITKFTKNSNAVSSEKVNEVQLEHTKLGTKTPQLEYEANIDLQIKVAFVKNGTDDLISLATIVTFTDVDENQAVSIDTGVEAVLCGSKVILENNTARSASTSNTSTSNKYKGTRSVEPNYRSNWLVYRLSDTSEFTYTYYHGDTGTIHGIGDANVTGAISDLNKIKLDNKITVNLSKYNIKKRPEPEEIPYVESSKETYVPIIEVPKMKVAKTGEAAQVLNHLSLVFFITAGLYLAKQKQNKN